MIKSFIKYNKNHQNIPSSIINQHNIILEIDNYYGHIIIIVLKKLLLTILDLNLIFNKISIKPSQSTHYPITQIVSITVKDKR